MSRPLDLLKEGYEIATKTAHDTYVRTVWGFFGFLIFVSGPYQWLPGQTFTPVLAVVWAVVLVFAIWRYQIAIGTSLSTFEKWQRSVPRSYWVAGCLTLGITLRVLAALIASPDYVSDPLTYWNLAQRLAMGQRYYNENGASFWPPGLPLTLAPFIVIFGATKFAPFLMMIMLFVGTSCVAMKLAQQFLGESAARVALLILAVWPNYILLAVWPNKELLVTFLLSFAVWRYLRSTEEHRKAVTLLPCGIALGLAALTQPAVAPFGIIFFLYELIRGTLTRKTVAKLAIVAAACVLTVMPWSVRNYEIHGEFIPINTAGGLVLYSANNDHATGGWIPDELYIDEELKSAGEIAKDRLAHRRALDWIRDHKLNFIRLAVLKETRLLCCDNEGAFELFRLAYGRETPLLTPITIFSNAFWLFVAGLIVFGSTNVFFAPAFRSKLSLILILAVVYFLFIFSVFQSEGRHHANLSALIALMAACAFYRPTDQFSPTRLQSATAKEHALAA